MRVLHQRNQMVLLVSLSLAILTMAVYWQVLHFHFLIWDDWAYVVENPHIRFGFSRESVGWAFTATNLSYWHPLAWLSHMLDCELYGINPRAHHLNGLLFHALNTVLVFLILHKATGAVWKSAMVAALFSIHPLRIESVAWVSERKDVLGSLFWLLTLLAYIRYTNRLKIRDYLLVLLLFSMALMTKATLVTLPFVLLLLDYWPLRRIRWDRTSVTPFVPGEGNTSPGRSLLEKLPLFLLSAASVIVTLSATGKVDAFNPYGIPWRFQVGNGLVSYVRYMGKMIWPADLAFLYPHPMTNLPLWQVVASIVVLASISALCLLQIHRRPYLAVGWAWYLGTLIPVSGFIQVGAQAMADRFTYLPHLGLSIAAVWTIPSFFSEHSRKKLIFFPLSGFILLLLSLATYSQLPYWRDNISLFSRALEVTSKNHLAHHLLGNALSMEDRLDEATIQFSESLKINPNYIPSLCNLALTLSRQGKLGEAAALYAKALYLQPEDANIHNSLGHVLARLEKTEEAVSHFQKALEKDPHNFLAHSNLADVFVQQGRFEDALYHYKEALRVKPGFEQAEKGKIRAVEGISDLKREGDHPG